MAAKMPAELRATVYGLRVRTKTGYVPDKREMRLLESAHRKYPEDYKAIGDEAITDTWPAGATRSPPKTGAQHGGG